MEHSAQKKKRFINFNAPVILSITALSLLILIASFLTAGKAGDFLAIQFTSWSDPLMYIRMFTHAFTHKTFEHFSANMTMLLVIGPIVEEKYGSINLLFMTMITAFLSGLFQVLLFRNSALIGASGIVFMLILLASFVNLKEGTIPLTVILVAIIYIGNEIVTGVIQNDNISQITHIIGGLCGAGFGYLFSRKH